MNSSLPKTVQIMQPIIGHQHLTYTGICCRTMGCYQKSTGRYNRRSFLHFDSLFITYLLWYNLGALRLMYCPNTSKYMEGRDVTHRKPRICMSAHYKHDQESKNTSVTYLNQTWSWKVWENQKESASSAVRGWTSGNDSTLLSAD